MSNQFNNEDSLLHKRKERIFFLYRNYLLGKTLNDLEKEITSDQYGFNEKQKEFVKLIIDNISDLENRMKKFLPEDWRLERFNFLERSILLNATAEIVFKKKNKKIIINESIEFAKKYCTEKSPSLINAILDKIGN